jgi:regulator of protease activity HflC (stomatin/prohibitin superfamily)
MLESLWILVLALIVLVIACPVLRIQHVIAYEYQKGLKYSKGRYTAALDPGQYWILPTCPSIVPADVRPEFIPILRTRRPQCG